MLLNQLCFGLLTSDDVFEILQVLDSLNSILSLSSEYRMVEYRLLFESFKHESIELL